MSNYCTSARPRSRPSEIHGIDGQGLFSRPEMIQRFREHYEHLRHEAEEALALGDEEIIVETYLSPFTHKSRREVKDGEYTGATRT